MATVKTVIFFSLALLAATAAGAHTPLCSSVDDHVLCTKLTGGAQSSWTQGMSKMLVSVRAKVVAGRQIAYGVADKMPASIRPEMRESTGATCRWVYDIVVDSIDRCIGFVKTNPHMALDMFLSATSTFSDCTDGLHGLGVTLPEVEKFDREVQKLSSILLAVAELKP